MKFNQIKLHNFMSYSKLSFNFKDGIWLIIGKNGSGKSTIFDAITFALYGKTRGDINSIIKDTENKCHVELIFNVNNLVYSIIRSRERNKSMELKLYVLNSTDLSFNSDLSEITTVDTQNKLNSIIGLDYDTFVSSIYFAQNNIDAFMAKTPSKRKELFFDMLGLGIYARAESQATIKKAELDMQMSVNNANEEMLNKSIQDKEDYIQNNNIDDNSLKNYEKAINSKKDQLIVIKDKISKLKSIIDNFDLINRYVKEEDEAGILLAECKENIKESTNALKNAEIKLDKFDIDSIIELRKQANNSKKCDKCGALINNDELKKIKKQLEDGEKEYQNRKDMVIGLKENIRQHKNQAITLTKKLEEIQLILKKHNVDKTIKYESVKVELSKLNDMYNNYNSDINKLSSEYMDLKAASLAIDQFNIEIEKERRELMNITLKNRKIREEYDTYKTLIQAFSRDGIPSYILENALPEIELNTNNILSNFMDESVYVQFRVQKETKSGTIKDTFDIVINENGKEKDYNTYSGGERVRINIAIRLAISALLTNRAGINIKMLMIDEIEYLDDDGIDKFVQILNKLNQQFDTIFVISHISKLKDMFSNILNVNKTYNGSEVK